MLRFKKCLGLMAAVMSASLFIAPLSHAATNTQSIAIPAYEYPTLTALWGAIDTAGSQVPFVIVNPASGPGTSANSDYTNRIATNTTEGIRSIGYVDTNYQTRPIADVMNDIDLWYSLYPGIQGIFFDRVSVVDSAALCYSAYAYNYAKVKHTNDPVIQNFGTYTSPAYEPYGDILVNAEMDHVLYQTWVLPADGFQNNPAYSNRFWHLVHTTNSTDLASTLTQTRNNNAGWVYITDDTMPNPYDTAPTYWNTELTSVATLPASTIPNRGVTNLPAGCLDVSAQTNSSQTNNTTTVTASLANNSTTYGVPTPTVVSFTLPNGVTLESASGTGWACNNTTCTHNGNVAAGAATADLTATFSATCSYQSGDITTTTTSFPQTTSTSSASIARPSSCPTADTPTNSTTPTSVELASTGVNMITILAAGATLVTLGTAIATRRKL
ncbi:spherulation-specific family 4 protein [Streptomyces caniscabiei]|uniref:spherulation-specific family 4 protein n=1 Tax=Streptomyces caniscabiei TaxID=2746961 RepID=UPI0029A29387|nr:spherulation-specific family 4 protein [Streptomyces caniscabiei]MDX2776594.1 spherulation-specific family 4 protein [Streptomyces caniscabiei]